MSPVIAVVDDEASQRFALTRFIERTLGYQAMGVAMGQEMLDILHSKDFANPDLLLLDLGLPDIDGMHVLEKARHITPDLPIIVLTGNEEVSTAVRAMQKGALDFMNKPFSPERLRVSITNALRMKHLGDEVSRLQRKTTGHVPFEDLRGQSSSLLHAIDLARQAARSTIPVHLQGESGVGKELFARAIHGSSDRSGKPFVAVNCGAIPENLVESTLFGHEKGAFTGAIANYTGKFKEADGGTLFLDEVGELPAHVQVKLLRALQSGEIEPVGATGTTKVNIRLISATNRDLQHMVLDGHFREDLFYRLHVFPITIPALRERQQDILLLANHFLARFTAQENKTIQGFSPEAQAMLLSYSWPGNVRQLENTIFRAVVLSAGGLISPQELNLNTTMRPIPTAAVEKVDSFTPKPLHTASALLTEDGHIATLEEIERRVITLALERYRGQISEIARRLNIGRSTLYRKMEQFELVS